MPTLPKGHEATSSGHTIVLSDLDSDEELLRLEGQALTHLRICNMPLDCQRALQATASSQIGQTTLRLTDERISLRTLNGLSIRVIKTTMDCPWELKGVSMVGVVT